MNERFTITKHEINLVWHEEHKIVSEKLVTLRLDASFISNYKLGVIEIYIPRCSPMGWGSKRLEETRLATIAVNSEDYRNTATKAQEIWNEQIDDYIAMTMQIIADGAINK